MNFIRFDDFHGISTPTKCIKDCDYLRIVSVTFCLLKSWLNRYAAQMFDEMRKRNELMFDLMITIYLFFQKRNYLQNVFKLETSIKMHIQWISFCLLL